MKKAFVVMSFDERYNSVYHESIKEALEEVGYRSFRADDEIGPGNIPAEIVRAIIECDVLVAEVSGASPNVYYELGISHCIGNKTVTLTNDANKLPFDIKVFRAIEYQPSGPGLRLLKTDLKNAVRALENQVGVGGRNLVQEAGRHYFDLQGQIRENLDEVRKERERLKAYAIYSERRLADQMQDNSPAADAIAVRVGSFVPRQDHRLLLCICGSGAIGKSTFSRLLRERIEAMYSGKFSVDILPTDGYMMSRAERLAKNIVGFDPKSHDLSSLTQDVEQLVAGEEVAVRPYDHRTGEHSEERIVKPSDVLILEGIYAFHPPLAPLSHSLRYYLYADPQRARELKFIADFIERHHDILTAFSHADDEYEAYARFILPALNYANFVMHVDGYWEYSLPRPASEELSARTLRTHLW